MIAAGACCIFGSWRIREAVWCKGKNGSVYGKMESKGDGNWYGKFDACLGRFPRVFALGFTASGNNVSSAAAWDAEKAERCLREVGFGEWYDETAKGLETPIYKNFDDEGINISGGEAQKIALARALYKDAPFIILDEPTAALDPIAEAEIYAKFDEIVGDKTAIYISHRLSSCRFCDKIAVFDNGEIVQVGSHEELLSDENGKYYELWTAQAQYYTK